MTDQEIINYEDLVNVFESALTEKLRQHSVGMEFLELWVPDSDPVKSMLAMIDAAHEGGKRDLAIKFGAGLMDDDQRQALIDGVADIGRASLDLDGDVYLLSVNDLHEFVSRRSLTDRDGQVTDEQHQTKQTTADEDDIQRIIEDQVQRIQAAQEAGEDTVMLDLPAGLSDATVDIVLEAIESHSDAESTKDGDHVRVVARNLLDWARFAAVDSSFRPGVRAMSADAAFEGDEPGGDGGVVLKTEKDGVSLGIRVNPDDIHRVIGVCHNCHGDPMRRGIYEAFCRTILGVTIQDAADYSGFKLLHNLKPRSRKRPVRGIMMSTNVSGVLHEPVEMMRKLRIEYAKQTDHASIQNSFEAAPSLKWQALSKDEKIDRIVACLADFLVEENMDAGTIELMDLTPNFRKYDLRVWIQFDNGVDYFERSNLTRRLERRLKDTVEDKIQLFNQEIKDESPLRRLTPEHLQSSKAKKRGKV